MREYILITVLLTIILAIIFFPRKEEPTYIYKESDAFSSYEITITGAVNQTVKKTFYEPMMLKDILSLSVYLDEDADLTSINLYQVYDKDATIVILKKDLDEQNEIKKLNINQASFLELLEIPGMQERQAASIILYREQNGLFISIDELINCKYIGVKTLESFKTYLFVQ